MKQQPYTNIIYHAEVITPLFMSGTDRYEYELREQSIKGVLRYWARVYLYSVYDKDKARDLEFKIFGGISGNEAYKSLISLRILNRNIDEISYYEITRDDPWDRRSTRFGISYLAYGLSYRKNTRSAIKPGSTFDLKIIIDNIRAQNLNIKIDIKDLIHKSISLASFIGGFGSRNRRGFGTIHFQEAGDIESLIQFLNKIKIRKTKYDAYFDLIPNLGNLKIYESKETFDSWVEAMEEIGSELSLFRSRYQPDYRNVKYILSTSSPKDLEIEKAWFGLPLNYYFRSLNGKKGNIYFYKKDDKTRLASPLIIRILKGEKYKVILSLFDLNLSKYNLYLVSKYVESKLSFGSENATKKFIETIDYKEIW